MSETRVRPSAAPCDPAPPRSPLRVLAARALPLYLSMLATLATGVVGAVVLGRVDTAQLAAHALVTAVLASAVMAVQGALRGTMPFVARHEDDPEALRAVVRDGVWLALLLGCAAALAVLCVPPLAGAVGVAAETRAALGVYPWFVALHALTAALTASATTLLVALGRNRSVLALSLVGAVLALATTPPLVLGLGPLPALGLTGAGWTLVANGVVVLVLKGYAVRRALPPGARPAFGAPVWARVGEIARVGLPSGATLLVKSVALGALVVAVARLGAVEAATHQFLVLLAHLLFLPALAVGQSMIPLVARAVAQGDPDRARRTVRAGYALALPVTVAGLVPLVVFAEPVAGVVSPDPAVGAAMAAVLPLLALVVVADGVQVVAGTGLVALRRTTSSLYVFACFYGGLVLAAGPLTGAGGLTALWAGYAVAVAGLVVGQTTALVRRLGELRRC
ncbi:MATE family efflux transporter [Nocardiopsis sp. NPDC007018]|uniref:MATE family efflux transporter n=1 Tax=Nocardiopsis sp. NPDC007018 TaxID=3155721 RepID=UPI0033C13FB7